MLHSHNIVNNDITYTIDIYLAWRLSLPSKLIIWENLGIPVEHLARGNGMQFVRNWVVNCSNATWITVQAITYYFYQLLGPRFLEEYLGIAGKIYSVMNKTLNVWIGQSLNTETCQAYNILKPITFGFSNINTNIKLGTSCNMHNYLTIYQGIRKPCAQPWYSWIIYVCNGHRNTLLVLTLYCSFLMFCLSQFLCVWIIMMYHHKRDHTMHYFQYSTSY